MQKTKILIVEDDIHVAAVLEARLESFGHTICAIAKSGHQAVAEALRHKPELIIMDILLEGDMNGIEAAERILGKMDTPIIFLTCLNDQEMVDRALKTKPFGYIVKPYDTVELRSSIEITLYKHRAEKERSRLINDLEKALGEVRRLSGLLPICANCKRIRDENDHWEPIEVYIHRHSEADFSHGICPDCARHLYPELYNNKTS